MKNVHHLRGKRLLAAFISMIGTGAILSSSPATALSPPNIVTDIEWNTGFNGVADIMNAFNNARRNEEMQLGLTHEALGTLTLPSQAVWDGMSDDAKALYLINAERTARAGMQTSVLGLPLAGIETKIDNLARDYAQLLHDNSWTGHHRPSNNSTIDGPFIRIENGIGTNCREFMSRAENLAYFGSSAPIPLPIERSIYAWIYDDASSNWGHREAVLLQDTPLNQPAQTWGFKNNHGVSAHEGFLGIHHISSTSYKPFGNSYTYGSVVVMKVFDPVSNANAGSCGYNVTLRTEDLPTAGNSNNPPAAVDDDASTTPNTAVTITDTLDNDSDPDDDTLTITSHTNPTKGSVIRSGNNFTYTPNTGISNTTDTFTYTISDGKGGTATATVTITIGAAPPSGLNAVNDSVTTDFGKAITFNVLDNDTPKTGVNVAVVNRPTKGKATVNSRTGVTKYTPKKGAEGSDTFTYRITNAARQTATATVNVTITPLVKPVAQNDEASTKFNTPVTVNVVANDTGTGLSLVSATRPTKGKVKVDKRKGSITYTPNKGTSGTDTLDYTVKNSVGGTATAKVTMNVNANTAPTASFFWYDTGLGRARTLDKMSQHTNDADGDVVLANQIIQQPKKGTIRIRSGKFVYTPKRGESGADVITYTVKDIHGAVSNTATMVIRITETPNPSS